jgi:Leucine-rich repeat (LRR) protein
LKKNDFLTLENLKKLSITGNQISSIESGSFNILKNLTHLNLRNNQIASFRTRIFENLAALTHLDLGENKLSSLRYDMISTGNIISHFYADQNSRLISIDILTVWRLSNAEVIDLRDTGCDMKYDKNLPLSSFRTFFDSIVERCS